MTKHIPDYPLTAQKIGAMASWPASEHLFEPEHILALRAAEATGRPLLVRGEAGTGKSQLAHAAAFLSGRAFLPVVVGSNTEAQDLHWKFDAIARLADAHAQASQLMHAAVDATGTGGGSDGAGGQPHLHVKQYVQPGALWWALNWDSALAQQESCRHGAALRPATPENWTPEKGVVLLIDEIDKAEPDLPNGLLEALANRAFDVPLLGITVGQNAANPRPLIIITTNDERELPTAFLRRCLVMTMALPEADSDLLKWLIARGKLHFPALVPAAYEDAAQMLLTDRKAARERHCYTPGLAEYLDLLRAVQELGADGFSKLQQLKHFYFNKQAS